MLEHHPRQIETPGVAPHRRRHLRVGVHVDVARVHVVEHDVLLEPHDLGPADPLLAEAPGHVF